MTLPLCVIGAGSIGQRHIEVAGLSDHVRLTAVVEPNAGLRDQLAQTGLPMVAALDDVPADTRAAIIATPTQDHALSGAACIARGWATLVEKPTAGTLDAARALVTQADTAGVPLFTGHHRRCHPFSIAAREALAQIGDLVGVQGLWSLRKHTTYYDADWRRAPGAGPLLTNLTHEIDLMRFLVGEMLEASALLSSAQRRFVIEDTASIAFRFANGALGSFLISDAGASPWSFEAASHENPAIAGSDQDYLRFVGSDGALAFPSLTRWGRSGPGEIEWSKPLTKLPGQSFPRIDPLLAQIDRFAAVVNGAADDVLCTGADGIKAMEMTLAAALSGHRGHPVKAGDVPGNYTGV
ncbi:Gfo/Idh/MocA family protein [Tropicibacter naphthalenivorans]|uniref:4-carboxy-2-hydroxymuconate-6-semialdehyde dehydrogenase n=1 Tax=Tropicibacter naphthalenivorans TaxID=441103 RepID=A0A0P1G2I8_9RHOB|nr:Gfo/Idh/MocA family oxidoreductase [Tropicibacter naphthalenivorans]CUH76003.1 4-carboxy-2-hydroxymuconate-6-semialdehyde dehydrogenase [Tropicibacter naphthalenivorans]SMC40643.1 Predicted dehydrogenase [Tropicibacter naphthalenivorans]